MGKNSRQSNLKVLVLGWEFPPYSWGGLGVACYGLVKGLVDCGLKVTLFLPYGQKSFLNNCEIVSPQTFLQNLNCENFLNIKQNDSLRRKIYNNLYTNLHKRVSCYAKSCFELSSFCSFDLIHAHDWLTFKAAINLK